MNGEHALQRAVYEALVMIEETDLTAEDLEEVVGLAQKLRAEINRLCDLAEIRAEARRAHNEGP